MNNHIYLNFYGFDEPPFSITPDPSFLFLSNTHKSVIDKVVYGIESRMGFILLVGEVGTGKTTICRSIIDSLENKADIVYIINPSLSGKELISSILDDLKINYTENNSKKDLIDHLNNFLLSDSNNKPVVIVIDDAQTMSIEALEDLRLLSNLETDKAKLIQMVLVGQPELVDMISKSELRQLRQRMAIYCHLDYLTKDEVSAYIQRRIFIAGNKGHVRFSDKAINLIFKSSNGIPRLINMICDYSLIAGFVSNDYVIEPLHVKKAYKELGTMYLKSNYISELTPLQKHKKTIIWGAVLAIFLFIIIITFR
ncbi:MAG: AAA family ATPase [Desulfobacterales bacterium]|nr:AAA family ATPase [Desulfobacterales bacterium]MBF0395427.1 AAA family ATPase [Desulfobacterales bacterium]